MSLSRNSRFLDILGQRLNNQKVVLPLKSAGKPKAKVDVKMKIPEKPFKEIDPLFDDHAMWVADDPSYIIRRVQPLLT